MTGKNKITKAFGFTVRDIRLDKKISQEKLAELGGLDRSYISEIENGYKAASIITVCKLALALSIKPSQLFQEMEKHFKLK